MDNHEEVRALLHEFGNKITPVAAHLYMAMLPSVLANEGRHYTLVADALKDVNDLTSWIRARLQKALAIQAATRAERGERELSYDPREDHQSALS